MTRNVRRGIRHAAAGFTLIELMIALVIAGVLLMIAVPAYQDSVRKSRRSEAFSALSTLQQAQERWRSSNAAYTATLSDLGASSPTPSGYYAITLEAPSSATNALRTGYIATATAVSGTSQAGDTACAKLAVRMLDGNLSYCGVGASASCTFTERNACWVR